MDATEYDTNCFLINNISSISYYIYEPTIPQASTYPSKAFEIETLLRSDGRLVYGDPVRRGLWCFQLVAKDGNTVGPSLKPGATLEISGYKLKCVEDGTLDPASLSKGKAAGSNVINTPNSSASVTAMDAGLSNPQAPGATGSVELDQNASTASPSDVKSHIAPTVKEVYKSFVSAVLSSLTSAFCCHTGAVMLSPGSLLLPKRLTSCDDDREAAFPSCSILATFRIYLTSTGSLVLSLLHSLVGGLVCASSSLPMSSNHGSTPVLAAPLGTFASFHALEQDMMSLDLNSVHSPDTQIVRRRPDNQDRQFQWCEKFAKILQARGLPSSLLDGATWMHLRRQNRHRKADGRQTPSENPPSTILWPSTLCFWRACVSPSPSRSLSNAEQESDFDPLLGARRWFTRSDERSEAIIRRGRERETAPSRQTDTEQAPHHPNGFSPLALRRASNTGPAPGAAGSMYPTPPDGVQNPVGVTPSFDGNVSSPGNAPATTAVVDIDAPMGHNGTATDTFGDGWEGTEVKRERHSTSFMEDPDNMFDDIGADMFGDNDITDADFNFFDEQPEVTALDYPMPDITSGSEVAQKVDHNVDHLMRASRQAVEPTVVTDAETPIFAKPELKHARSSMQDDFHSRANQHEEVTVAPTAGVKRQPSPFSPDTVFKRIRAALDSPVSNASSSSPRGRRRSVFDSVNFSSFLAQNNQKYQENGRFECHWERPPATKADSVADVSTTAYLRRHGGVPSYMKISPSTLGVLATRGGADQGAFSKSEDSDADDDSIVSELDDASHSIHEAASPSKSSVARRRIDDDAISLAASFKELETVSASPQATDISRFLSNECTDLQLSKYFAEPDLSPVQYPFSDEEYMTIAQILTEQVVSGTLNFHPDSSQQDLQNARRDIANCARSSLQTVRTTLPSSLANAMECTLKPLAEVQDVPTLPQPTRLQPRNPAGAEQTRPSVFQIPAPHIEIRRHETKLSLVPSSITFWEVLGLGPSPGTKDIHSACVFPKGEGMSDSVTSFLEQTRIVYEALKLGTFDRLADSASINGGLVQFEAELPAPSPSSLSHRDTFPMMECMSQLCQALTSQSVNNKNFLVFFIYSAEDPRSMVECCAAFQRLFEMYKKKLVDRKMTSTNDLVMQLIPLETIASPNSPVILQHSDYIKLCLEIYDRGTLFDGTMPAPAICLEQLPPRMIDFKLTTTPSANLLHENSCIHIAYTQSVDGRWVTAAWTDNRGSKQMTASYCLGRKGKSLATPLADVAHEIWDTTHDLISMWKVHWRVIITKCGPMEREEIDYWVELAKAETKASVTLTLLTVDTDPSLQLLPPAVKVPVTAPSVFYTTPVSTPQTSIVSPEQSGNPPTPSMAAATSGYTATTPGGADGAAENDGDTTLVDVTDSTWGAVLSHRLQNTSTLGEINPALISGYLVKRGGTRPEDPPVVMEVNVVHAEHSPRLYETLLREMLLYFRGLGTLARARNIVSPQTDVRPWHIAAVEKAARLLSQLM